MSRNSRRRRGLLCLCAALLAVGLPAAGSLLRPTVLFQANFDSNGDGGGVIGAPTASIGSFVELGPDEAFVVEVDPNGSGHLLATNVNQGAVLRGVLDPTSGTASRVTASIYIEPGHSPGHLIVRFSDEGDTPLIDVEFTPSSDITVAGSVVMTYGALVGYDVTVSLDDPVMGPSTASVAINGSDGSSWESDDIVINWLNMNLGSIDFTLPPTELGGDFVIDDVLVITPGNIYQQASAETK